MGYAASQLADRFHLLQLTDLTGRLLPLDGFRLQFLVGGDKIRQSPPSISHRSDGRDQHEDGRDGEADYRKDAEVVRGGGAVLQSFLPPAPQGGDSVADSGHQTIAAVAIDDGKSLIGLSRAPCGNRRFQFRECVRRQVAQSGHMGVRATLAADQGREAVNLVQQVPLGDVRLEIAIASRQKISALACFGVGHPRRDAVQFVFRSAAQSGRRGRFVAARTPCCGNDSDQEKRKAENKGPQWPEYGRRTIH